MARFRIALLAASLVLAVATPLGAPTAQASRRPAAFGPSARSHMGMANDAATGQVVLFGGWDGLKEIGDTWTWDGSSWTEQYPADSPKPRCCLQMAYDAVRGQVLVYGGWDGSTSLFDTWTWDGTNWTELFPPTSPDLSSSASTAFDASTRKIVLHSFAETWTWDGATWTKQEPAHSPSWRETPGLSREGVHVLLFGGDTSYEEFYTFRDTWRWDGTNWVKLQPLRRPARRSQMGLAYDQARRRVVLFGGTNFEGGNFFADTWTWDRSNWSLRRPPTSPPGRAMMGFAYDSTRRQIVMFGGRAVVDGELQYFGDTWTWDGTTWTEH